MQEEKEKQREQRIYFQWEFLRSENNSHFSDKSEIIDKTKLAPILIKATVYDNICSSCYNSSIKIPPQFNKQKEEEEEQETNKGLVLAINNHLSAKNRANFMNDYAKLDSITQQQQLTRKPSKDETLLIKESNSKAIISYYTLQLNSLSQVLVASLFVLICYQNALFCSGSSRVRRFDDYRLDNYPNVSKRFTQE